MVCPKLAVTSTKLHHHAIFLQKLITYTAFQTTHSKIRVRVFMDKIATNIYMQISDKNSFISTHILFNLHVDLKHRVFQPKTKLVNDMYSDLKFHFMRTSNHINI